MYLSIYSRLDWKRFLCKNCICQFTQGLIGKCSQTIKLWSIKLYKEGDGLRKIGKILNVSFEIIRLWILRFSEYFKPNSGAEYDVVEVNELCTFLKNKRKNDGSGFLIIAIQGKYLIFIL